MAAMTLVEQHIIRVADPRFEIIDAAAFAAKNLYNRANYEVRQSFFHEKKYIPYSRLAPVAKQWDEFKSLPAKVAQWVLRLLDQAWRGFFAAIKEWRKNPEKFRGRPKPPGYKDKKQGRTVLTYTMQAISRPALLRGEIRPSRLPIVVKTKQQPDSIQQVRIVPRPTCYVVEVIYEKEPEQADVDPALVAGIDIGLDNLITLTSNKVGFQPVVVNGRSLKAINQYYNKRRACLQSLLPPGRYSSRQLDRLTAKRNRRLRHWLHVASRRVVDCLVAEGIGTLVIGKNPEWKQEITLGKRVNQNFVQIPHARLVDMLVYKCKLAGIRVILQEESYTSKCSFLDGEEIRKQSNYAGRRIKRGLFRAGDGRLINADVNAAYNIIRKAIPDAFADGIAGVVVHPVRWNILQTE